MTGPSPDPAVVARLLNLDPNSFFDADRKVSPAGLRRMDGSPATAKDRAAFGAARICDWDAAKALWQLNVDQKVYEYETTKRIADLVDKYSTGDNEALGVIALRMTTADRAELSRLIDNLGGVLWIG